MTPSDPRPEPRWRAFLATVLTVAFVGILTLTSAPVELPQDRVSFTCLLGFQYQGLRDVFSNTLLFLPLGWTLRHWLRPAHAIVLCVAATCGIEALQATVIAGRDSSLRDILSNTIGGALGVWFFSHWRGLRWPEHARSLRLGTLAAAGWIGLLAVSAAGNRLALSTLPLYGHWAGELAYYDHYPGTVLSVNVNGWSPPNGAMPEPAPLREAMMRDSFLLSVRVVSGRTTGRPAPMFFVSDQRGKEQVFLGQDRRALGLHIRNRFESWGLRGLDVRLPLFPGREPGDTVLIEAGLDDRTLLLRAVTARERAEVRLPQTVGWGWAAMLPFRYAVWHEWTVVNALWLASLTLPLGYWLGRASPLAGLLLSLLAVGLGLTLIPFMAHAAGTAMFEWIGGLSGALLSWAVGAHSRGQPPWTPPTES